MWRWLGSETSYRIYLYVGVPLLYIWAVVVTVFSIWHIFFVKE